MIKYNNTQKNLNNENEINVINKLENEYDILNKK